MEAKKVIKNWEVYPILNQGITGACVAISWCNSLNSKPYGLQNINRDFAIQEVYWEAQRIDLFGGGEYLGASYLRIGTSLSSVGDTLVKLGLIRGYRREKIIDNICRNILEVGPAIIGCKWYKGMSATCSKNYIKPKGDCLHHHCVLIVGIELHYNNMNEIDMKKSHFTILNTKGKYWGINGRAKIKYNDFMKIMSDAKLYFPIK